MRMPRIWKKIIKISSVLIIVLIFSFASFLIAKKYNMNKVVKLENELNKNTQEVYVAVNEIERGCLIESNMVKKEKRISDLDTSFYFKKDDIGSVAITDINIDSPILKTMVSEQNEKIDKTLREINYSYLHFGKELKAGDYVDVRIRYMDGEDYIVVGKIKVTLCDSEIQKVSLLLSEEQQLMISSAIIDSSMYKANVYLTKYTDPILQEQPVITYQPSVDVIDQIMNNSNIEEVSNTNLDAPKRIALEKRLFAYLKSYENINEDKNKEEEESKKDNEADAKSEQETKANTENVIYYYDYTGQGVDSVLDSISNANNTQVKNETGNNVKEKEGVKNGGEQ